MNQSQEIKRLCISKTVKESPKDWSHNVLIFDSNFWMAQKEIIYDSQEAIHSKWISRTSRWRKKIFEDMKNMLNWICINGQMAQREV